MHPAALNSLYSMYFCACFVERTWRFGLPLVLAFIPGGFQAIACLGFVAPLACTLAGPAVGACCRRGLPSSVHGLADPFSLDLLA